MVTDIQQQAHYWPVDHLDMLEFDPLLHRLVREEPVARIRMRFGEGEAWLVTGYELVKEVTADPRLSRALTVDRPITAMAPYQPAPVGGIGRLDPPEHTRLRGLVSQAFNRRRIAALRTEAVAITERQLAGLRRAGPPGDLVRWLTVPLPEQITAGLLGVPAADLGRLQDWRSVLMAADHTREQAEAVKREVVAYFRALAERRAAEPADDLFSELVAAHAAGELTGPQLTALPVMLLLNALDQVRNQVATMVYALLTHPEQLARLRAEPALLPRAVGELLRFIPQRNGVGLPRVATADLVLGGVTIRAGDPVYVSYLAANRDPAVFTDPDRLDLTRAEAPHLAFGHGVHYCVGAALTRMQAEVVLAGLLDQLPELRLAVPPQQVRWLRGTVNRGPEELPLAW